MIELVDIYKAYAHPVHVNQSVIALNNLHLKINSGEIYGVLGKSGAGKSTLLRCVNLLEKPTQGKVFVNNIELTALSNSALKKHRYKIGIIFQHFNLLESRNVFDNIALPLEIQHQRREIIVKKVSQLLKLVELEHRKDYFPSQLSGGQKQRVAIARALACDPHVLLSDEATSALDAESTDSILSLLKKINEEFNLTILLITHQREVAKAICHRVGILHEGKLMKEGPPPDVLNSSVLFNSGSFNTNSFNNAE